jgi:zinc transport system substrate-binding protein
MMRSHAWLWLMLVLVLSTGSVGAEGSRFALYTVNYPLQYFAERIAGDHAEVIFPAPPDIDPAFWLPSADDISAYQKADLIILNGAGYAKWVDRVTLPRRKLLDTSSEYRDRLINLADSMTHSHGPDGDHSHSGKAFTTWLDLTLAIEQSRAIAKALANLLPLQEKSFMVNLESLENDLMALDQRLQSIVARYPRRVFIASHPVYEYLERQYGLDLESVMWEPDEDPGEDEWEALSLRLTERAADWMIWESEPNSDAVARLETLGVWSLVFNPVGNRPSASDFIGVMTKNVEAFEQAMRSERPSISHRFKSDDS